MAKNKKAPNKPIKQEETIALQTVVEPENIEKLEKWVPAILAALIFVSYAPIWQNSLVWDDKPYIVVNNLVQNFSLGTIGDFFYGPL